jgi:hypothetical protein
MKMKTIKYFILLLIATQIIVAQDRIPTRMAFDMGYSTGIFLNSDQTITGANSTPFKQTDIIRGWQWGANPWVSLPMKSNQADVSSLSYNVQLSAYQNTFFTMSSTNGTGIVNNKFDAFYSHGTGSQILNTRSIQFEAGLKIDNVDSYKNYTDNLNPVFGFKNICDNAPVIYNDNGNKLLQLGTTNEGEVVLSEPWSDTKMEFSGAHGINYDMLSKFRGDILYLTIRIKTLEKLEKIDATPVLTISAPIVVKSNGSSGYLHSCPN